MHLGHFFPHTGPHSQGRQRRYRLPPLFAPGRGPRPRPDRDTAERFGDYAALVGEALAGEVGRRVTVNEPWGVAWRGVVWLGYSAAEHVPGKVDDALAMCATHQALLDAVEPGDTAATGAPLDFLGVNYNSTHVVASTARVARGPRRRLAGAPGPTDEQGDGGPGDGGPSDDGPSDGDGGPGDGGRPGTARPGAV
jgi:beta-glucosidase/6-phospho-beta-glucosidase/beta-galactosidase